MTCPLIPKIEKERVSENILSDIMTMNGFVIKYLSHSLATITV